MGGWGLEDLGNIHGWALWLCKHVDEVGKDENVKKTLSRKVREEKSICFSSGSQK